MASILKVDTIQDQSGNNIINESGDTITIGASGDTVNVVGTLQNNGSALASGITVADQWRLTADFTGPADPISSNLEQVDTGSQGTIGSAMTVSSGIFTFPSTGIWLVMFNVDAFTSTLDGLITLLIQATTDNSTYNDIARGNAGITIYPATTPTEASATTYSLVDVTDTTQVKVKFKLDSVNGTTTIKGDTAINETFFTFIRLGDT